MKTSSGDYRVSPAWCNYPDSYSFWKDKNSKFEDLSEAQRVYLIREVGFIIWEEDDGLAAQDTEGGNLGDIESDRFKNTIEICNRIEHYFDDYFEEY